MTYKIEPDRIICHDSRQRADGSWLKFGVEAPREFSLSPVESLLEASKIIDDTFKACNTPSLTDFNSGQPEVIDLAWIRAKETVEKLIDDAATPDELTNHWDRAVEYHLKDHYEARLKELS